MAARLNHRHLAGPMNAVGDANSFVEPREIRAAAKEHMLAVVDDFVHTGMQVGTGPSAEIAAPFYQLHAQACLGQRAGSTHAGNPAADDGDCLLRYFGLLNQREPRMDDECEPGGFSLSAE
jgi:hypothetical protein